MPAVIRSTSLRRRARWSALAAALALTAAACSSDGDSTDGAGNPAPSAAATEAPASDTPAAVQAALQFTAPLVGGGEFDGAELAAKPTVFWFWAPT